MITAHDFYVTGYMCGYLGLEGDSSAYNICYHMFRHTLKDNDAEIKVVATDPYGRSYTETVVLSDTDFSQVAQ